MRPAKRRWAVWAVAAASLRVLLAPGVAEAQRLELVDFGETWRYFKGQTEASTPVDAWRLVTFDDSAWLQGPTGIGYGDSDDATVLADMRNTYASVFARKSFSLASTTGIAGLFLDVAYDDGFIAYLNGVEVARANMPAGPAVFDSFAATVGNVSAPTRFDLTASTGLLQPGTNVLAFQVHNANLTSSDLSFYPRLYATGANAVTRGPFLQLVDTTSVGIAWTTALASTGEVAYGRGGRPGPRVSESAPTTDHLVVLTGLEPETVYAYRIAEGGGLPMSDTFSFRTARRSYDTRFRVAVLGDSGNADVNQWNVKRILDGLDPDLVMHTGDIIYPMGEAVGYDPRFFDPYRHLIATRPAWPVLGNHEWMTANGQPYLDAFHLPTNNPSGTERNYSFRYADTLFVALDASPNILPGDAQYDWLVATLAASTDCFKIVWFHQPPYNAGAEHGMDQLCLDLRANLAPVFDTYGVDLVLNGHEHDYERSFPLRGNVVVATSPTDDYVDPGGTIYVVTGGGGRDLDTPGTGFWTAFSAAAFHAVLLERDGPTWTITAHAVDGTPTGTVIDQATLTKTTCPSVAYNVFRSVRKDDVLLNPLAMVTTRTYVDAAVPARVFHYQVDPGATLVMTKTGTPSATLGW